MRNSNKPTTVPSKTEVSKESAMMMESLKLCVDAERAAEQKFIRYSIATIVSIVLLRLTQFQTVCIELPVIGKIPSLIVKREAGLIVMFLVAVMGYAFLEWVLNIIDLNRHALFSSISGKRSLAVVVANHWDEAFKFNWVKAVAIIDFLQNLLFLLVFGMLLYTLVDSGFGPSPTPSASIACASTKP